jgi:hypothetical protein
MLHGVVVVFNMIYPSCKNGNHGECPVYYAKLIKCKCACHAVIGSG